MNKLTDFYDLDAWKESHQFVKDIYKFTKEFPREEKYGLIDQIRRAACSVTANIAEGFGRYHYKDKTKFYYQARGSLKEVQNFLLLAKDLDYIPTQEVKILWLKSKDSEKLINGLIRSANKQNL